MVSSRGKRPGDGTSRFVDDFRALIIASGKSPYAIARDTNGVVDRSQVYRFLAGKRGLTLTAVSAIADQLGIRPMSTA